MYWMPPLKMWRETKPVLLIWLIVLSGWMFWQPTGLVDAAPLQDDPNPFTCLADGGVTTLTWTTTSAITISWTPEVGYNTLLYFGDSSTGTSADEYTTPTYGPVTPPASGEYYLRLASSSAPSIWYTCFTYRYDVSGPNLSGVTTSEAGGAQNNVWQYSVSDPSFTINNLTDPQSGLDGFYSYFGTDPNGTDTPYTTGSYVVDPPAQTDGTYYLRINAVDELTNASGWQTIFTFLLDTDPPDDVVYPAVETHSIPEATWQGPADPTPSFTWTAGSGATRYLVYWGTNSLGTSTDWVASPAYTPPALTATGTYYLRVRSADEAGNTSTNWVTMFTYWADLTPPSDPSGFSETNYGIGSGVCTTKRDPIFEWDPASDGESGVQGYAYYWGGDIAGTTPNATTSSTTKQLSVQSGDKFYLRMASYDEVGNYSNWVTGFILCNGDVVNTMTAAAGGSTDMEVPYEYLRAMFTFPINAYMVYEDPNWVGKDFYTRIWYPNVHHDPDITKMVPYGHESFSLGLDSVEGCNTITDLNNAMTITFTYSDYSALAILEDKLKIYRWDNGSWNALSNQSFNVVENKITATTTSPGEFIVMGDPIPVEDILSIATDNILFGSISLSGNDISASGTTNPWIVLDASDLNSGWYITIHGSDFSDNQGHIIAISNVKLRIPTENVETMLGTNTIESLVTDDVVLGALDIPIISSTVGSSKGKYAIRPIFTLTIPAETYEGSYSSQMYVTLISGPIE